MGQEGIAAALKIDQPILDQLKEAQGYITTMQGAASSLATSMSSVATSAGTLVSNLKGGGASLTKALGADEAIAQIGQVADAAAALGQSASAVKKDFDYSEEIKKTRAELYELQKTKAGMDSRDISFSREEYVQLGRDIDEAKVKLQGLLEQRQAAFTGNMEKQRGGEFREYIAGLTAGNDGLKKMNKEYREMEKSSESAKKSMESINEQIRKTKDTVGGKQAGLGGILDGGGIVELQSRIESIKRSLQRLKEEKGEFIDPVAIRNSEIELQKLDKRLTYTQQALTITSRCASSFGRVLRSAFSTVLISKFISNVVKIRGEFEMAERSLAVIIQDANYAREIFGEIQTIAVRSPFQVKDLVKYTKQLAAFRVESNKLVETTKMLGDISAGVGVDMDRLILAYGQVKAATYLKGTELRQFSEAGVNMLGGLADRFSEIQKRAVSTGEVLQMVSKRMVSFADVDAVLRQQTEFGGAFFKMQEKQAETIQGRISNIRDKLDIMFNEIGKSSQGFINFVLNAIDKIIENYKYLEAALASGTVFMAINAIFGGITKLTSAMKGMAGALALIRSKDLFTGWAQVFATGGPLIGGAIALGTAVAIIVSNANKLKRELKQMANEAQTETDKLVLSFEKLAFTIKDTTKSTEERENALEEMKQQFGNIIPVENEHIDTIDLSTEKQNEYTAAIRETNAELLKEKQLLAVRERRNQESNNEVKKIQKRLAQIYSGNGREKSLEHLADKYNQLPVIYRQVQNEILDGTIKDLDEATKEIIRRLEEFYGAEIGVTEKRVKYWAEKVIGKNLKKAFNDLNLMDEINSNLPMNLDFGAAGSKLAAQMKQAYESLYKGDDATLKLEADKRGREYYAAFYDAIENSVDQDGNPLEASLNDTQKASLKRELDRYAAELLSPFQKQLYEIFNTVNTEFPKMKEKFGSGELMMRENESLEQFVKRIKDMKKSAQDVVDVFAKIHAQTDLSKEDVIKMTEVAESYYGKNEEEAKQLVSATSSFIKLIEQYLKTVADKSAIAAQKRAVKEFLTELKNAAREMDKLDDEGDALFTRRLKLLAKQAKIQLPDDFDPLNANFDEFKEKYLSTLDEADQIEIQLAWNNQKTENEVKEYSDFVQDAWDRYNNAKKMEDYGIVPFDGKSSMDVLQELAAKEKELREKGGRAQIDLAEEIAKKRQEIARTEQENIAKMMYDLSKKALDKEGQAYKEMLENVKKIREAEGFTPEQKEKATADQVAKSMKEIADAQWDAFKASESYALTFGDLTGLSDELLHSLKENLQAWLTMANGTLQPTEVQAILKQIRAIEDQMGGNKVKTFFGAIVTGFEEINERREVLSSIPGLSLAAAGAAEEWTRAQGRLNAARLAVNEEKSVENLEALAQAEIDEAIAAANAANAANLLASAQAKANKLYSDATNRMRIIEDSYSAIANEITGTLDLVTDFAAEFGLAFSDETLAAIDGFKQGFALVGQAISLATAAMEVYDILQNTVLTSGKTLLATLGPVLWPLLAAAAAIGVALAVIKAKDASLQKQVERHKDNIEKLEKGYEKLGKAMDSALNIEKARQSYAEMSANIAKQRQELNEAIDANNRRKQNDNVRKETEDLKEQLEDLDEKVEETREKWLDMLGGITDARDIAQSWASDWLKAFKETGNGLDSLKENFDELYDNLVVGQLWTKVMGPKVEALEKLVNDAIGDGDLTESEAAAIRAFKATFGQANEDLQKLAEQLGIRGGGFNGSTLQRGVETVSEQTASALESIMNATRFDVSDTNVRVANIENALIGDGENTILSHLRSQTRYLADIARIASAVYVPGGHYKGGNGGIKVFAEIK